MANRDLKSLANETYDVLIVGGGINGLAAAWDASLRGLRVALVERSDFGGATSAASLKIIHGGLRYLQHLDFRRMRESIRERSILMRIAPHLIKPLPFLVPTYGHGLKGKEAMATAIKLNDWISRDRNRYLHALGNELPNGRVLSREECLGEIPIVPEEGLTGGVVFYDGQMQNSDRVTLSFAFSAFEQGAALANYTEVVRLLKRDDAVTGAQVRDVLSGEEFDVQAKVVLNCAGPWLSSIQELASRGDVSRHGVFSKGFQVVLPNFTGAYGLAITSTYQDPDAKISRGARHYFITPWQGHALVGTTDALYEGDPDKFDITPEEVLAFVEEVSAAIPKAEICSSSVQHAFGGLRPVDVENMNTGAQTAKETQILDHRHDLNLNGFISVEGVKYTTCRLTAEQSVDCVVQQLAAPFNSCRTAETSLCSPVWPDDISLEDQVKHAIEQEWACRLTDVILRRTDLGVLGPAKKEDLQAILCTMEKILGWNQSRVSEELKIVSENYPLADSVSG